MTVTKKSSGQRSAHLFFVEIIIVLLFFCLSGAIILRVFAAADLQAKKSSVNERVILCAQSAAEVYSVCGNIEKTTETVFGKSFSPGEDGTCTIILDKNCTLSADADGVTLVMKETREESASGTMSRLTMAFRYAGSETFSMTCGAYIPSDGEGAAYAE